MGLILYNASHCAGRSERSLGQILRELALASEVSQILHMHKKVYREKSGIPRQTLKTSSRFLTAALHPSQSAGLPGISPGESFRFQQEANFFLLRTKFGIIFHKESAWT